MIKIWADSMAHLLTLIPQNSLVAGILSTIGKKLTLFQFIKNDKQIVSNYRPKTELIHTNM